MRTRTRFELTLAVLVTASFLVIACQPQTAIVEKVVTEIVATSAPTSDERATKTPVPPDQLPPWDDPYEAIDPELCPRDADPVGQPEFGDPVEEQLPAIGAALVQHGVFANEQGELFRVDVVGVNEAAMREYTENVWVCFDLIPAGPISESKPSGPESEQAQPASVFENEEDLIVLISLLGVLSPDQAREVVGRLVATPIDAWQEVLQEHGFDLDKQRELEQEYVFDFVIDPTANNWSTHQYPEKQARKIWVTISVSGGGGSVKAALCRNGWRIRSTTVERNSASVPDTATMSHNGISTTSTYDLGVKGNSNGTYRVSGRWLWPGWSAGYYDSAPTGSYRFCSP